ncbi:hypothetical protein J6590_068666, partial [Homalodisca vitripennis]
GRFPSCRITILLSDFQISPKLWEQTQLFSLLPIAAELYVALRCETDNSPGEQSM